jgi:Type II secretion system (T2SS), protein M subtype b
LKIPGFLEKGKISQKKFLWGFIGMAVLILVYTYGIVPLVEANKKAEEEIVLKQRILQKYAEVIQNRKKGEEALERSLKQIGEIENRLLPGETPQLGGAGLQDIVKRISEKNGIALRSFRILEPKEVGVFRRISLQIEFNPISSMLSLGQFIYDLENQEKKLMISEMDLLVFNPRMPNNIQGNLVVSGFMKESKFKEPRRKR